VMELLEGETLESLWERFGQRLPHEEVARLAHQVLDVLVAAHQQGIVHRDIKPSNLFLTREGRVKVLDFGIARLVERDRTDATGRQAISPIGTPDYMPPEQAAGLPQDVDGRADIWAVGATMFTLLSGCGVHAADTLEDVLAHAATLPVRPLGSVAPAVPDGLASVVDRALAFDRDARWPSAGAMRAALEAVYPTLLATDEASRPSWTFLGGPHSSSALVAARDESMGLSAPRAGLVAPTLAVARRQWGWAAATAALIVVLTIGTLKVVGAGHHDAHDATPLSANFPSSAGDAPLVSAAAERLAPPAAEPVGEAVSPNTASTTQTAVSPSEAMFERDGGARRGRRPTSAEPTPRPACDPPFRTDRMARRIPKPECL
jgi:serine/threonine protein kinase